MKLATWNVNSVRARMPRLLEFLAVHEPDVVCLQETKTAPGDFPAGALREAGYEAADESGGRWAGVAILAREDHAIEDVARGLPGSPLPEDARWIEATVAGVRAVSVYVVNGRALDDPMYEAKLAFLDAMAERAEALADHPLVIAGDFNIARADMDVWDPAAFEGATHTSAPEARAPRGAARGWAGRRLPRCRAGDGAAHLVGLPAGALPPRHGDAHRSRPRERSSSPGGCAPRASIATSARARSPPTTRRCCSSSRTEDRPDGRIASAPAPYPAPHQPPGV